VFRVSRLRLFLTTYLRFLQAPMQIPQFNMFQFQPEHLQHQQQQPQFFPAPQPAPYHPHEHFALTPEIDQVRQYSQGPQGDPFAPQMVLPYHTYDNLIAEQQRQQVQPISTMARNKKKGRPRKDDQMCSFCNGTALKNKHGVPERLSKCFECHRSGMSRLVQATLSY